LKVKNIVYIAMFVAIISIMAQIQIPLPGGVPMTLQSWGIVLSGLILGKKNGSIAALVYITLGAIGVPIFTGMNAGMAAVLGPTGGFIFSFPIMAFFSGIFKESTKIYMPFVGVFIGVLINFAFGMIQFSFVTNNSFIVSFSIAVLPFLFGALLQIISLPMLARLINTSLAKSGITI